MPNMVTTKAFTLPGSDVEFVLHEQIPGRLRALSFWEKDLGEILVKEGESGDFVKHPGRVLFFSDFYHDVRDNIYIVIKGDGELHVRYMV